MRSAQPKITHLRRAGKRGQGKSFEAVFGNTGRKAARGDIVALTDDERFGRRRDWLNARRGHSARDRCHVWSSEGPVYSLAGHCATGSLAARPRDIWAR